MQERLSLYRDVHKGIRVMLLNLVERTGQTDFEDPKAVARLSTELQATLALLSAHAHKEDTFIQPLVARFAPKVAFQLSRTHEEHEAAGEALLAILAEVSGPQAGKRGHALYLELTRLVSEQLAHMAAEEQEAMPALWSHLSDEELAQVNAAVVGSIPPEEMNRFMAIILPALNGKERLHLLNKLRSSAPPAAVNGVLGLARGVLPAEDYAALEMQLA